MEYCKPKWCGLPVKWCKHEWDNVRIVQWCSSCRDMLLETIAGEHNTHSRQNNQWCKQIRQNNQIYFEKQPNQEKKP